MKIKKIGLLGVALACLFASCDRHDNFDDTLLVGEMAPQVYWEVSSTTVRAGSDVPFTVQYFTTNEESALDHLEVWYGVWETISKTVACPWMISSTFTYTFSNSEEKRVSLEIEDYAHDPSYWTPALSAYSFSSDFPVSNTLASTTWKELSGFGADDSVKMNKYYGEGFMENFKDSLYGVMIAVDFEKMYSGLNLVENFRKQFMDSIKNNNTGRYDYVFPETAGGDRPVPAEVAALYEAIPFADLVFNASMATYDVSYEKIFKINAVIKAVDVDNNIGTSMKTEITIN